MSKFRLKGILPPGLWFALVYYLLAGIYSIVIPVLLDPTLIHMMGLGIISFLIAANIYYKKKPGFWLTVLALPVMFVFAWTSLASSVNAAGLYPTPEVAALHATIVAFLIGLILSAIFVVDKRNELKPVGISVTSIIRRGASKSESQTEKSSPER